MAKRIREKAEAIKQNKDIRPKASAKYIRISPSKLRIVMNTIRGKKYSEALAMLDHTPNAAADYIKKAVVSAGANAENNLGLSKDDLFISEIYSSQGPTLKRLRFRAKGRVDRILKRSSHIYVVLDKASD